MAHRNIDMSMELAELLGRAAELGSRLGIDKDIFLAAAFSAFLDAQPGLREELADRELAEQLASLRERGLIAEA